MSNPFRIDGDYVIATLVRIKEAGVRRWRMWKRRCVPEPSKTRRPRCTWHSSGATLEEVAEAGSRVSTASGVSLKTPSIQGAGGNPEPDVIGAAYALPLNEVSAPIQGTNGVGSSPRSPATK